MIYSVNFVLKSLKIYIFTINQILHNFYLRDFIVFQVFRKDICYLEQKEDTYLIFHLFNYFAEDVMFDFLFTRSNRSRGKNMLSSKQRDGKSRVPLPLHHIILFNTNNIIMLTRIIYERLHHVRARSFLQYL